MSFFLVLPFQFVYHGFSCFVHFFFFKQKTAYDMLISYWISDVCSSDLPIYCPHTVCVNLFLCLKCVLRFSFCFITQFPPPLENQFKVWSIQEILAGMPLRIQFSFQSIRTYITAKIGKSPIPCT